MRPKKLLASLLFAACASGTLAAQRYVLDAPGKWKPWTFHAYADDVRRLGARPADVKAVEAHLLRLNEILRKTDGITNPIGFSVETGGGIAPPTDGRDGFGPALTVRPLPYSMAFGPFAIIDYGTGAAAKRVDTGETPHIYFSVNDLGAALYAGNNNAVPEFEQIATDAARLTPAQPDTFGMPRYGDMLVLKKSAEPIAVPVTLGEALEILASGIDARLAGERERVAQAQKVYDDIMDPDKREERMAQYRKIAPLQKDPAYLEKMAKIEDQKQRQAGAAMLPQIHIVRQIVTGIEQELAAAKARAAGLSEGDKAAPACYAISDKVSLSRFRRAPASGCDPLVRPNWKVFNPALPRTAPQLLFLTTSCLSAPATPQWAHGCTANTKLLQSVDKAALLAWLQ